MENNGSIKKYFEEDHDRLDSLFRNFQRFKRTDYQKAKEFFKEFKFGLQKHIVWEEDIIFPLFEQKTAMFEKGPTHVMRMEHKQIADCLESVHKYVQKQDPNSDKEEETLLSVLFGHNMKEENVLYPAIDGSITDIERNSVFESMRNLPEDRYKTCCGDHK